MLRYFFKKFELLFFILLFLFSWFLMIKTFKINAEGNLEIATKVWSDFAATIPLVRSFSLGINFPPQYPVFAGPPIRYHFLFFTVAGFLEKVGVPLDWALNSVSAFSFFLLTIFIYLLAKEIFKKRSIAMISVILFLFNGSLSFLEFFRQHPLSTNTLVNIVENDTFPSFGPYDGKTVSAFWSLNIFTNQRHLAFAYASFLALILIIYKLAKTPKKSTYLGAVTLGLVIGVFPFIHLAVFGMMGIALLTFFVVYPKLRSKIILTGSFALALAVPQILYMGKSSVEISLFNPGYLVENLNISSFLKYWFLNLGLLIIIFPLGFILANKKQRKVVLPFFSLLLIGNLFQFSVEMSANHKFFNLFVIGANIFIAFFLVYLWKEKLYGKLLVPILFLLLTLSGIIDIFPIFNDRHIEIKDFPNDPSVTFILEKTPKDAVFLNSSFLYDPASLAGRKIYLGWPYFSWSAGYNTDGRFNDMQEFLAADNKDYLCGALINDGIDYIEIQEPTPLENVEINFSFFENNFAKIFYDPASNISIYDIRLSCKL